MWELMGQASKTHVVNLDYHLHMFLTHFVMVELLVGIYWITRLKTYYYEVVGHQPSLLEDTFKQVVQCC